MPAKDLKHPAITTDNIHTNSPSLRLPDKSGSPFHFDFVVPPQKDNSYMPKGDLVLITFIGAGKMKFPGKQVKFTYKLDF